MRADTISVAGQVGCKGLAIVQMLKKRKWRVATTFLEEISRAQARSRMMTLRDTPLPFRTYSVAITFEVNLRFISFPRIAKSFGVAGSLAMEYMNPIMTGRITAE